MKRQANSLNTPQKVLHIKGGTNGLAWNRFNGNQLQKAIDKVHEYSVIEVDGDWYKERGFMNIIRRTKEKYPNWNPTVLFYKSPREKVPKTNSSGAVLLNNKGKPVTEFNLNATLAKVGQQQQKLRNQYAPSVGLNANLLRYIPVTPGGPSAKNIEIWMGNTLGNPNMAKKWWALYAGLGMYAFKNVQKLSPGVRQDLMIIGGGGVTAKELELYGNQFSNVYVVNSVKTLQNHSNPNGNVFPLHNAIRAALRNKGINFNTFSNTQNRKRLRPNV